MRVSRIPHPPGSRYIIVHRWAIEAVGAAAAAVLGLLDFLDRCQPQQNALLATRTRIIADLEGLVGRNAVDDALRVLTERGWAVRHDVTTPTSRNLRTTHWYALCSAVIAQHLHEPWGKSEIPESGKPTSPDRGTQTPETGAVIGAETGTKTGTLSYEDKEEKEQQQSKKAQTSSASTRRSQTKARRVRPSGIVTWTPDDVVAAEALEASAPPEEIQTAISVLKRLEKEPVPGLVGREIEKFLREREKRQRDTGLMAQRRAESAQAERRMREGSPAAAAALASLPPSVRPRRLVRGTTPTRPHGDST